eukprot:TRINITY_DN4425_c0_g1_i1.p1 TRINITY_DN4425_c0_g1~~TRINITY_DN4425_c0_g1_i1.p1  ORF type:complete len:187 (+),score=47.75 TRINITY_DN4425_c0_g1_i1:139-699(+)
MDTFPTNQVKITTHLAQHQFKHKRLCVAFDEKLSFLVESLHDQTLHFQFTLLDIDTSGHYIFECKEGRHKYCYSFSVLSDQLESLERKTYTVTLKCKGSQCVVHGKKRGCFCIAAVSEDGGQVYGLSELVSVQTSRQKSKSKKLIEAPHLEPSPGPPSLPPPSVPPPSTQEEQEEGLPLQSNTSST